MYEFPYVSANGAMMPSELIDDELFQKVFKGVRFRESIYNQQPVIHKLSHRKIHAYFWIIQTESEINGAVTITQARLKPHHVLIERFMKEFWKN